MIIKVLFNITNILICIRFCLSAALRILLKKKNDCYLKTNANKLYYVNWATLSIGRT